MYILTISNLNIFRGIFLVDILDFLRVILKLIFYLNRCYNIDISIYFNRYFSIKKILFFNGL